MEINTKYGWFILSETATGLMAEKFGTHSQYFIDGDLSDKDLITRVEKEYELINNL